MTGIASGRSKSEVVTTLMTAKSAYLGTIVLFSNLYGMHQAVLKDITFNDRAGEIHLALSEHTESRFFGLFKRTYPLNSKRRVLYLNQFQPFTNSVEKVEERDDGMIIFSMRMSADAPVGTEVVALTGRRA